ncbi:hypothetical protein [Rhodococcus pyridinivorans]|uniref:Holin n=1 Tax=Rhodococcus pyridinivorans TaxID=103816 RepID=A0A7M2XRE1_9NOCA|nr:hypothetical protein [Rhodococcus pyridinivorans]QOV99500.1 hypothetical protein INP59_03600 [Rhodococcus pyridinivorans]
MNVSKIAQAWPTIRQVIYSATAALFGGLTLLGVLTDAQVTQWLGHTLTILTAIGTGVSLLASLYTPNPKGAQAPAPTVETRIEPAQFDRGGLPTPPPPPRGSSEPATAALAVAQEKARLAAEAVGRTAQKTVGQMRADLENRLRQ